MTRAGISYVPVVLGLIGLLAGLALVSDHNVRTWAVVMSCTTLAAVGYGAYQEQRAQRAVRLARKRIGTVPYDEVRREMDRARRHERPLAIARLEFSKDGGGFSSARQMLDELNKVGARPLWRSTDRFWRDGRNLFLLLPETRAASALAMVERALRARSETVVDARVASFPENGVTVGALFQTLGSSPPAADDVMPQSEAGVAAPASGMAHVAVPSSSPTKGTPRSRP